MLKKASKISVIVPVYNEEKSVGIVLGSLIRLRKALPMMEIVVVDDGSKDRTADEVLAFPVVRYVRHEENRGKGAALLTGFEAATGDIFVVQDADLEYSPSDIPKLVEPMLNGRADVVYGSRFKAKCDGMSLMHQIGNRILSLTTRLLYRVSITDVMTGHKCFTRQVLESLDLKENDFNIEVEITAKVLKNGWRLVEVPITYSRRPFGNTKISYTDGISSMIQLIKDFIFSGRSRACVSEERSLNR